MMPPKMLAAIVAADPDGKETRPSDNDYLLFKNWVIERYGKAAWRTYKSMGKNN
jgi:hypothetical protein